MLKSKELTESSYLFEWALWVHSSHSIFNVSTKLHWIRYSKLFNSRIFLLLRGILQIDISKLHVSQILEKLILDLFSFSFHIKIEFRFRGLHLWLRLAWVWVGCWLCEFTIAIFTHVLCGGRHRHGCGLCLLLIRIIAFICIRIYFNWLIIK